MKPLNRARQIELLKMVPMFADLSKRQLNAIGQKTYERSVEAGQIIAKEGEPGREFFIIADGNVHIEKNKKLIRTMTQGQFFGEISLIDGRLRTSSAIAKTPVTLLCVHNQTFSALLKSVPGLSTNVMFALCQYVRRAEEALAKCQKKLKK